MEYLPEFNHLLAVLAGLLFINQLRLRRSLRDSHFSQVEEVSYLHGLTDQIKEMGEMNVADIESMTATTTEALDSIHRRIDAVQDAPDRVERLAGTVMDTLHRVNQLTSRVDDVIEEAISKSSIEAMAVARQLVENMVRGKSQEFIDKMDRVEAALAPLPPMREFKAKRNKGLALKSADVNAKPLLQRGDLTGKFKPFVGETPPELL